MYLSSYGPKSLTHRSAQKQLHPLFFFRGHLWRTSGTRRKNAVAFAASFSEEQKKRIRDHLWPPRSSMAPLHPQGPKTHPSMLTGTVWRPCARKRPGIVPDWRAALPPHLPIGLAAGTELNGKHCQQPGQPSWGVTRLWAGVGAAAGVTGCLSSTGLTTWSELESLDWWG